MVLTAFHGMRFAAAVQPTGVEPELQSSSFIAKLQQATLACTKAALLPRRGPACRTVHT